jgi:hypothetical protein
MDEAPKVFAPELSPAGSRRWIGRLVIAVVLGAAIWNFIVALTVDVVVPGLARVMEADPQSALYLGKGDINIAAVFVSLLELCFAVIAGLAVNALSEHRPRPARKKSATRAPLPALPSIAPPAAAASPAIPVAAPRETTVPTPTQIAAASPPPRPAQPATPPRVVAPNPAQPAKAEKPPKPKKVYYNSVGDPIEVDDE